jgi:diaminopimelate epimerase
MVQFSKLHGNGNDFIIIDEYNEQVISDDKKAEFARKYCDRRFGIGADGVLYLLRSKSADLKMRLFQPDCSEAEMCGNGIRCLAKYAMDAGYVSQSTTSVETMAGLLQIEMKDLGNEVWVKVNMGRPLFNSKDIPMKGEGDFIDETLENMQVSVVNTGVPHAVIFVDNLESVDIDRLAPPIRYNPVFTKGTNVNLEYSHI